MDTSLGEGNAPYSGQYGEAPPVRGALFKVTVYKRAGEIAILVYERLQRGRNGG